MERNLFFFPKKRYLKGGGTFSVIVLYRSVRGWDRLPAAVSGNKPALTTAGPERTTEIELRGWTRGGSSPWGVSPLGEGLGTLCYTTLCGGKEVVVPTTYHSEMLVYIRFRNNLVIFLFIQCWV